MSGIDHAMARAAGRFTIYALSKEMFKDILDQLSIQDLYHLTATSRVIHKGVANHIMQSSRQYRKLAWIFDLGHIRHWGKYISV